MSFVLILKQLMEKYNVTNCRLATDHAFFQEKKKAPEQIKGFEVSYN